MNTILVALDLSQKDNKLINRAVHFALATGAKLHVLNVYHEIRIPAAVNSFKEKRDSHWGKINDLINKQYSGDKLEYEIHLVSGGRVHNQIDKCAQEVEADLVIVGISKSGTNTPDFVLSTLERLLVEASYPVLIVTQDSKKRYDEIAVHAPFQSSLIETLNIIAPVTKNSDVTLHGFLDKPNKGTGFWARLRQKHAKRKDEKLHEEISSLLKGAVTLLKRPQGTLPELSRTVSEMGVDLLALEPLNDGLFFGKPEPELREILANPPCDLLMIGRG